MVKVCIIPLMMLHIPSALCSGVEDDCLQCTVPLDGSESDASLLLQTNLKAEWDSKQVGHFSKQSSKMVSSQVPWQVPVALWSMLPLTAMIVGSSLARERSLEVQNRHIVLFCFLTSFIRSLDYTLIIPTVYDLTKSASASNSAVASGFVIAAYHGLSAFGVLLHHVKGLNEMPFRQLMILVMCSYPITGAIYIASALVPPGSLTLLLMMSSRCAAGVVEGVVNVVQWSMLARVSHSSCATKVFVFWTLVECLGEAYGPVFSSSCFDFLGSHFMLNRNVIPSVVMFFVHLIMLLLTVLMVPSSEAIVEDAIDITIVEEEQSNEEDGPCSSESYRGLVCAGLSLAVVLLMYGLCSGLESATAMILEVHYGWSTISSGYAIGACFGCVLPVLLLSEHMSGLLPEPVMQQFSLMAICCMTALLLPQTCMLLQTRLHISWGCEIIILLSDACVFPLACLVYGLAEGRMSVLGGRKYADRLAAVLTVGSSFVFIISQPLARYLTARGVTFYASLQIGLGALALLVNIAMDRMMPMKTHTKTDPPQMMPLMDESSG